jgi:hypothetical protein
MVFCETTGTIFHGRRNTEREIIEALAWLAEGSRISSVSRVQGYKEDTILGWQRLLTGRLPDCVAQQKTHHKERQT